MSEKEVGVTMEKEIECTCGNLKYGFDCTCQWSKDHPGIIEYVCEFCGIYVAGKPRCHHCEGEE